MLFQHLMRCSCAFFSFKFVHVVDYVDGFLHIEPSLRSWSEAYLVVVNFDVYLDLVGKNFIEYFCVNVHKEDWSEVLLVGSLCGFGITAIVAS